MFVIVEFSSRLHRGNIVVVSFSPVLQTKFSGKHLEFVTAKGESIFDYFAKGSIV